MSLPQFNAESSLGPASGSYAAQAVFGGSGGGGVSPMQFAIGGFWTLAKCCGPFPPSGKIFCIEQWVSPFYQCECRHNFFGTPYFYCHMPVIL